jgi:hypothetical protein
MSRCAHYCSCSGLMVRPSPKALDLRTMKKIKLTNCDKYTLVDDDVFEAVKQYRWRLFKKDRQNLMYASTTVATPSKSGVRRQDFKVLFLHQIVLPKREGFQTDHINRDKLDNRRENLRHITNHQNQYNRGVSRLNKTGYKGVSLKNGRYVARCNRKHLGSFKDAVSAAKVYNEAAKKYHGEFAFLNEV